MDQTPARNSDSGGDVFGGWHLEQRQDEVAWRRRRGAELRIPVAIFHAGFAIALSGMFMILSAGIGLIYHDGSAVTLAISGMITAVLGISPMMFIPRKSDVTIRESVFVVAFGWIGCSLFGALPFYLHGAPFNLLNALFESVSGFTTTGASILTSPESLPKGLLFWRTMTHWLGGVGIVAFALLVIPRLGQVSRPLLQQEFSGLGAPPPMARAKDITRGLFAVYSGLTFGVTFLLMLAGIDLFDAVTTSMATIATGGFSVRDLSIAHYQSPAVEAIVMMGMLAGALNFVFVFSIFTRPRSTKFGWEVTRFYLLTVLAAVVFAVWGIYGPVYDDFWDALRYGSFQVITMATQCGFGSADSSIWPVNVQTLILIVAIIGGCAGSTAGAIKVDRFMLFFKLLRLRFISLIHPNIVPSIRVDGRVVDIDNIERAVFYIPVYLAVLGLGSLLLSTVGLTAVDSISGSIACLANAGPGMGSIGTMENYAHLPMMGKWILILVMLLGRLEVFALVLPFTPGFWRS